MSADGGRVVLLEASRALDKTSTGFDNAANPFLDKIFIFDRSFQFIDRKSNVFYQGPTKLFNL